MPRGVNEKRRDVMLNGRQCAESIGISVNAFRQWRVPCVRAGRENLYSLQNVLMVYRRRVEKELRPILAKEIHADTAAVNGCEMNPAILATQLTAERVRLTSAQADQQEMKNRMLQHEIADFRFITHVIAMIGNALAAVIDAVPQKLIREVGLPPKHAETVRGSMAGVANQIASLIDEDWVKARYDDYLSTVDQ